MVYLEDLVPDVLFLMLLNAPSTNILWGFIRSSQRMYSVFRDQRELILSAVITREIGHGMLGEAQSALRLSQFQNGQKPSALEWIATYEVEMNKKTDAPEMLSKLLLLLRRHHDVKFMARLMVHDMLPIVSRGVIDTFEHSNSSLIQKTLEDLSYTERTRIYRGFYRLMIYGSLFRYDQSMPEDLPADQLDALDQSHSFLKLFPAWQVEELSCVNDFIHDKIKEKWREAEDRFYNLLKDDPSSWDVEREDPWGSRWEIDPFFSHSAKVNGHTEWQEYLATLTISDLREIFTAVDDDLMHVLKNHLYRTAEPFLTEALDEIPYHSSFITPEYKEHKQALASGVKAPFLGDCIDKPNEGWLWAHQYKSCELYVSSTRGSTIGEGLRRFGYVFWDSTRLHRVGILQMQ
jgi:hypothetical protein